MKASRGTIGRSLDQPDPNIRFYLLYGPDEGQSRALGERLMKALGATRFVVEAGTVKADPALLADEASAMSLFGGSRVIWIEPATKDIEDGVAALLEGGSAESPVVAIGGALPKTSALLKRAEASPLALAFAAYPPQGMDAERMVSDVGRTVGLKIDRGVAARLAEACGNDQAIVAQEVAKLALYLGAAPESPKELGHDAVDAVGAALPEGDFMHLADLALSGELGALADALAAVSAGGGEAIPVVRSLQRRLLALAPLRARVERGERVDAVLASLGKSLFFKDKGLFTRLLEQWDAKGLATAAERAGELERQLLFSAAPAAEALGEELVAIGIRAARRR